MNFILEIIPILYPKGFWNEDINVYNLTKENINTISNKYSLLNIYYQNTIVFGV